jgi:hypothetical protein
VPIKKWKEREGREALEVGGKTELRTKRKKNKRIAAS